MDARIAQLQQKLKERDAEINRLETEQRVRDKTTMKNSYIIIMIFMYRFKLPLEIRVNMYLQCNIHLRSPR